MWIMWINRMLILPDPYHKGLAPDCKFEKISTTFNGRFAKKIVDNVDNLICQVTFRLF